MIFYIKDLKTKKIIDEANNFEEALEKLKERGEGYVVPTIKSNAFKMFVFPELFGPIKALSIESSTSNLSMDL